MSTVALVRPGTHHIRFIVDGQMQTSPDLPTTVDFGNNLVNYIEVTPEGLRTEVQVESEAASAPKDEQEMVLARILPSQTLRTAKLHKAMDALSDSPISSTISRDNTAGDCARHAQLLARYGPKMHSFSK